MQNFEGALRDLAKSPAASALCADAIQCLESWLLGTTEARAAPAWAAVEALRLLLSVGAFEAPLRGAARRLRREAALSICAEADARRAAIAVAVAEALAGPDAYDADVVVRDARAGSAGATRC